jgi:hypothetical protein
MIIFQGSFSSSWAIYLGLPGLPQILLAQHVFLSAVDQYLQV